MTFLRTISTVILTSLLAACGGQYDIDPGVQTAAASVSTSASATQTAASAVPTAAVATVASATMPAPDCAAEGCASLRIIDGNAETWRIDAQRRAALETAVARS